MDLLDRLIALENITWIDCGDGIKFKLSPFPEDDPPILDWVGIEENGDSIPYSKEKALEYLNKHESFAIYIYSFTGRRRPPSKL
jgi:hypothetical protein